MLCVLFFFGLAFLNSFCYPLLMLSRMIHSSVVGNGSQLLSGGFMDPPGRLLLLPELSWEGGKAFEVSICIICRSHVGSSVKHVIT